MLRYHSLHDNQYLRYFDGHTQPVTTIAMSPKNDMFMSAAEVPSRPADPDPWQVTQVPAAHTNSASGSATT